MIEAQNSLLRVKRIRQSKNGAFCIADLITEFGEFKVKDPLLEQFEEGEYEVTAWINEIFLGQYIAYGKAVTEIRARLQDLQVYSEDARPQPSEPAEMDPLDEQRPAQVPQPEQPATGPSEPKGKSGKGGDKRWDDFKTRNKPSDAVEPETAPLTNSDLQIFDADIWALIQRRQPVKLDPTIERAVFRQQAACLKQELGYRFDSPQQMWFPR